MTINGKRRFLKVGQPSQHGVRLLRADSEKAVIEVDGKQQTVKLSTTIHSNYSAAKRREVAVSRGAGNGYYVSGKIAGQRISMLVDTGASLVAMNSEHAAQLGIDYRKNSKRGTITTASGIVEAYNFTLPKVSVSGITVRNVKATVIEGKFPHKVLLGMSYLQHVKMEKKAGSLVLSEKY